MIDLELLAGDEAANSEVLNRKLVLAVGGEVVVHQHSAARAERQAFDVMVLRRITRRKIGCFGRRLPEADRDASDARGRGRIGLEQSRRDRQRACDVVEASGRIVWRQERRDVDLEIQQIADGICVLGAVQAVENDGARIDAMSASLAIDFRFEPISGAFRSRQAAGA